MKPTISASPASPALLHALGTMSDFKVAVQFGLRPYQVKALREQAKIPSVGADRKRSSHDWVPADEALLGTMPDTQLAIRLDTTRSIVNHRRTQLKCPAFVPTVDWPPSGKHHHDWQPEEETILGTDYDNLIAKQLGLNHLQVTYRRNQLGIDPFRPSATIEWTQSMLSNLGEISDKDFAEYFEICASSVYVKRLLLDIPHFKSRQPCRLPTIPKETVALLGIKTDLALSEKYGVNRWNFRIQRLYHGLAPAEHQPSKNHTLWTPAMDALLGSMSDRQLSNKISVSVANIAYRRRKLNIAKYIVSTPLEWDEQKMGMLGRSQDLNLAQMWHCDVEPVIEKRQALGIPAHYGPRVWLESELALLGLLSNPKAAAKIGISATLVKNKLDELNIKPKFSAKKQRWSKKNLALLGTMADERLAYQMKSNPSTVAKKRTKLGIPIWNSSHRGTWADPSNRDLLGTMSDPALAKQLAITAGAICQKRTELGIAAFVPSCKDGNNSNNKGVGA